MLGRQQYSMLKIPQSPRHVRRRQRFIVLAALACFMVFARLAQAAGGHGEVTMTDSVEWFPLAIGLLGGLAIFLFGMEELSDALQAIVGKRMKHVMSKLTSNRFVGVITGALVTGVIQSSSVTTVLVVGFISAGLMNLSQAIGIILGAKIGSTITGQIIAFKVTKYALLLVAVGFGTGFIFKEGRARHYGQLVFGLGMIFFGMAVMGSTMEPLRGYQPFIDTMAHIRNWPLAIIVAALFTSLIQSSAATMGIVIVLASQGLVQVEAGIALALGANIGTCATAGLAAIGKPREAVRAALAHVTISIVGAAILLPFIPQFADFARSISPSAAEGLTGQAALAAVAPRQIANGHTMVSILMAAMFLPFVGPFARILEKILPEKEITPQEASMREWIPKYLDEELIETQEVAVEMVRREVERIARNVGRMLDALPAAIFDGDMSAMNQIRDRDNKVDSLHRQVIEYISRLSMEDLSHSAADSAMTAMAVSTELEAIGDIIENNFTHLAENVANGTGKLAPEFSEPLRKYHQLVFWTFESVATAFAEDDKEEARVIMNMKGEVNALDAQVRADQTEMIRRGKADAVKTIILQTDIMENLKRIYYHVKRIAKMVAGEGDVRSWEEPPKPTVPEIPEEVRSGVS
ncbi:Na/Pi cotransporter family protein [bacterium]|nr:Na/Pi cotransporter family protein [bacterium]